MSDLVLQRYAASFMLKGILYIRIDFCEIYWKTIHSYTVVRTSFYSSLLYAFDSHESYAHFSVVFRKTVH